MPIDASRVGARLSELRTLSGRSLSAVAEEANVAKSYLAKLERAEVDNPGLRTLNSVARALGVTLADLLNPSEVTKSLIDYDLEHSDADIARMLADLPSTLRDFLYQLQEEEGQFPPLDVINSLASIQFRGKRPSRVDDWRFVYHAVQRSIE